VTPDDTSDPHPSRRPSIPRRLAVIVGLFIWLVAIPLVHGVLPWGLSHLAHRYGWSNGQPSVWNRLGLILVVIGAAGLAWIPLWGVTQVHRLPPKVKLGLTPIFLMTGGPYGWSRNPIYVADLILWLGWTILFGSPAVLFGLILLLLLIPILVAREERSLEARFGEDYRQYQRAVPRWLGPTKRLEN